jgi:hypothetical protein
MHSAPVTRVAEGRLAVVLVAAPSQSEGLEREPAAAAQADAPQPVASTEMCCTECRAWQRTLFDSARSVGTRQLSSATLQALGIAFREHRRIPIPRNTSFLGRLVRRDKPAWSSE